MPWRFIWLSLYNSTAKFGVSKQLFLLSFMILWVDRAQLGGFLFRRMSAGAAVIWGLSWAVMSNVYSHD